MRNWSPDRILTVMELLDLQPSELAAELGVTPRTVTYWLSGQRKPASAHVLGGLKRLEKEAVARLAQGQQEEDPMKRDAVLKALVGAPLVLAGRPFLPFARRVRWVDERYGALMEDVTGSWESAYAFTPTSELVESVLGHHQGLLRLLDRTSTAPAHRRLQVATGKTSMLMALLARDADSWSWSKHYANRVLELGWEAGHGGLEAHALSNLGYLRSPDFGDGSRADVERSLQYAQQAFVVAKRSSPPAMRSWCAMDLAKAEAVAGNGYAALGAQDQAWRSLSSDGGEDDLGGRFVGLWNEAALERRTGGCLVRLGRADEAERLLRHALAGDLMPGTRAGAYADLASIYVLRKEPEQACDALARAYAEAMKKDHRLALQSILRVRQDLDRWADQQCVRDLDGLLGVV